MYFACSPLSDDTATAEILASIRNEFPDSGLSLNLYAVIDAAFESSLSRWVRSRGLSVGDKSGLATLKNHLPFIIPLAKPFSATEISRLIRAADRHPMISFIASHADAEALASKLRLLLIAYTNDRTCWPLRFADTRVLPALLCELSNTTSRYTLGSDIAAWWWPRRDGKLDVFTNSEPPSSADPNQRLELSDQQFARMMNAAQADALISQLHEACPDILDRHSPHENHRRVANALDLLAARYFDSTELQLRWAALALSFKQSLQTVNELSAALAESETASELIARIDQLPEHIWAQQDATR